MQNKTLEVFKNTLSHNVDQCPDEALLELAHAMAADVAAYMKYYNLKRLHTSNGDMTPVEYENYQLKVSTWA